MVRSPAVNSPVLLLRWPAAAHEWPIAGQCDGMRRVLCPDVVGHNPVEAVTRSAEVRAVWHNWIARSVTISIVEAQDGDGIACLSEDRNTAGETSGASQMAVAFRGLGTNLSGMVLDSRTSKAKPRILPVPEGRRSARGRLRHMAGRPGGACNPSSKDAGTSENRPAESGWRFDRIDNVRCCGVFNYEFLSVPFGL